MRGACLQVELVLGAAVQCEAKDDFIRVIMTMPQTTQQVLMGLIQQQMSTFPAIDPSADPVVPASESSPPSSPLMAARSSFSEELREELDALQVHAPCCVAEWFMC